MDQLALFDLAALEVPQDERPSAIKKLRQPRYVICRDVGRVKQVLLQRSGDAVTWVDADAIQRQPKLYKTRHGARRVARDICLNCYVEEWQDGLPGAGGLKGLARHLRHQRRHDANNTAE